MNDTNRNHGRKGLFLSRLAVLLLVSMGPILGLSCSSLLQREAPSEFGWEEERLEASVGADFNKAAALRDLGVIYLRTGRFAEAKLPFTQSLNEDRSDPKTWFYSGLAYELVGNPQQALQVYKQSPLLSGGTIYTYATNGRIGLLEAGFQRDYLQTLYNQGTLPPTDSLREGVVALFPIDCQNTSAAESVIGLGLTDLINFHVNELRGISAIETDITKLALMLATNSDIDPTIAKPEVAARALGAGALLGGTCVLNANNEMQVDLVMRDLIRDTVLSVSARYPVSELLALENSLIDSLTFKLGIFAPNRNRNITTVPGGYDAVLSYSKGIKAERAGQWPDALKHFRQALAGNPRMFIADVRLERLENFVLGRGESQKDLLNLLVRLESVAVLPDLIDSRLRGHAWGIGFGIIPGQGTRRLPPGNAGELPAPPTPVRN